MSRRCGAGRTPGRCGRSGRRAGIAGSRRATCAASSTGAAKKQQLSDVGDLATKRIRRQVHSSQNADWYATVDDAQRERLRVLGRGLMTLVADYVAKRRRKTSLLEEARATGAQYGAALEGAGMSLSQAMHAFTFFRRSLDQSAKQALAKQGTRAGRGDGRVRADHGACRRGAARHRRRVRARARRRLTMARDAIAEWRRALRKRERRVRACL